MKIALLSDIHGNYEAFKTCVKYCEENEISDYIFLGDYLGEFAYPERTMALLYELNEKYNCTFIRGNKEEYWLKPEQWGVEHWAPFNSSTGALDYVLKRTTKKDLDFFAGMKISEVLDYDGMESITVCHGSPFSNREKLLPDDEKTRKKVEKCDTNVIICGHTHKQRLMEYGEKIIINPGAVGVACFSGGKTQFAILSDEDKKWNVSYVSLQYDVEKSISELEESGLTKLAPYWCKFLIQLLRGSVHTMVKGLTETMRLCEEEEGECNWPVIPEKYFEKAYENIFGKEELTGRDVYDATREISYPIRLDTKTILESKWMNIYCDKVKMPEGNIIDTYYRASIPNESVAVVVVNEENKILLIQSKRYTTSRLEWEIPAGAIDKGECAEQAARRECMEETGCRIKELTYMNCVHPCNGLNDVLLHFYIAKVDGQSGVMDSNEVGQKRWVSKDEVLKLLKNNNTKSGISAHGLLHALTFYL